MRWPWGAYLQEIVAKRTRQLTTKSIVVPYSDLLLPPGNYRLAYQVVGMVDGEVAFTATSPWTVLVVTEESRYRPNNIVRKVLNIEHRQKTFFLPDRTANRGFKIEFEVRPYRVAKSVMATASTDGTEILNGFHRKGVQAVRLDAPEFAPTNMLSGVDESTPWTPKHKNRIHFATNRNIVDADAKDTSRFGDATSTEIAYGTLLVNIPVATHVRGELERPRWYEWTNPEEHFNVETLVPMRETEFNKMMSAKLEKNDILVMVHGFNNSMEFAALRCAQVVHDIQFAGTALLFSWPSEGSGSPNAYRRDEKKAIESDSALSRVLSNLTSDHDGRGGRIHLLAHSMGSRVLLNAIHRLKPADQERFGHVVLAAPDVGVRDFIEKSRTAVSFATSVSMYACARDKALKASRAIHLAERAGESIVAQEGLLNIDATKANTSFLGHDYFAARSTLLIDLQMHLVDSIPPEKRQTLRTRTRKTYRYWMFP